MPCNIGRLIWQHLLKYIASLSTTLVVEDKLKYFTATGIDLNFFKQTVPNVPLLISSTPSMASINEGLISKMSVSWLSDPLVQPCSTGLAFSCLSVSLKLFTLPNTYLLLPFLLEPCCSNIYFLP